MFDRVGDHVHRMLRLEYRMLCRQCDRISLDSDAENCPDCKASTRRRKRQLILTRRAIPRAYILVLAPFLIFVAGIALAIVALNSEEVAIFNTVLASAIAMVVVAFAIWSVIAEEFDLAILKQNGATRSVSKHARLLWFFGTLPARFLGNPVWVAADGLLLVVDCLYWLFIFF